MTGFTLIELTVALSIMTILAAMLLPRIAQLQRMTRAGNLRGLHGSLSVRVMLVHSATQVHGGTPDAQACKGGGVADNQPTGPGTVCTEGGLVRTLHGYPASTPIGTPGVISASGVTRAFIPTESQLKAEGYRVSVSGGKTTFERVDASNPELCGFTYTQAPDAQTAASISTPVLTGC